jgi:hypothetical protein
MTEPVKEAVKRERRVTVSLRIPPRIVQELKRIGKRRYQTMSTCGAEILIQGVEQIKNTGTR